MMTPIGPEALPQVTAGFLSDVTARRLGFGIMVLAEYDPACFRPDMFDKAGILRPDTLARATDKRLAEFLAGRLLAHIAQIAIGFKPQSVGIGEDRAPIWPEGLVGSISHTRGRCACLVMPSSKVAPGIDVEQLASGNALESILRIAVCPQEAALLRVSDDLSISATLCFSAKEALFKALYPTVRQFFGFTSARICAPPARGVITLALTEELHPTLRAGARFQLNYQAHESYVLTWMLHSTTARLTDAAKPCCAVVPA